VNPRVMLHLDAAARNQTIAIEMLNRFDPGVTPPHDDWVITLAFYSALHLIDGYFVATHGSKPTSHRQRDRLLVDASTLSSIAREYITLRTYSEMARYQPLHSFPPYAVQEAFDLLEEIRELVTTELHSS
jgi:hypothetical protein